MYQVAQKKESTQVASNVNKPLFPANIWSSREVSLRLPVNIALWIHIVLLIPATFFLCFHNLDTGSVWGSYTAIDEARHIRVAQEMWLSGKWWLPTLDGVPYFLKPPFKMWLTLLPAHLLGESNFSYRCIDAALGVGLVGLVYISGVVFFRSLWAGFFAAFFLLGNQIFFFVHGIRNAVQDTMMLFLTSLVMLLGWKFFKECTQKQSFLRQGLAAGILLGLAAMTKSVAAYYPLLILGSYALMSGSVVAVMKRHSKTLLLVLILSVGIPALFYIPHLLFTEYAYTGAIDHELIRRFNDGFHNQQKRDFYLNMLKSGHMIPPLSLGVAAIYFLFQALFKHSREHLFVFLWAALPLLGYSFLHSRLEWYIAPCYLPCALMVGVATSVALQSLFVTFKNFKGASLRELAKQLVVIVGCFVFSSLSLLKGVSAVYATSLHVMTENPRLPIDTLSQDILSVLREKNNSKILMYNIPPIATAEHVYMNMLRPYIEEVSSADVFEKQLRTERFAFAMSSVKTAEPIIESNSLQNYTVIGPMTVNQGWHTVNRAEPIVVFSLIKDNKVAHRFHPSRYDMSFVKMSEKDLHFGWSEKKWGGVARIMLGSGGAIFLPADPILEHIGAGLSIKLARDGTTTEPGLSVTLMLNSQVIGEIADVPSDFTWKSLNISPKVLKEGRRNLMQFLVRYPDGKAIPNNTRTLLVASIIIRPPHLVND